MFAATRIFQGVSVQSRYTGTQAYPSTVRIAGRQAAASALPPSLPFEITNEDDFSRDFVLPFSAQIFGATSRVLRISADGVRLYSSSYLGSPLISTSVGRLPCRHAAGRFHYRTRDQLASLHRTCLGLQ